MFSRPFIVLFAFAAIQGIVFGEQCLSDQWPPKPDRLVPTHVVNLDLPAVERWKEVATIYKAPVRIILTFFRFIFDL